MIIDGVRIIKIVRATKAHLYGGWYKDLIDHEFSVMMFNIMSNEYTVSHNGEYKIIRAEDVEEMDVD